MNLKKLSKIADSLEEIKQVEQILTQAGYSIVEGETWPHDDITYSIYLTNLQDLPEGKVYMKKTSAPSVELLPSDDEIYEAEREFKETLISNISGILEGVAVVSEDSFDEIDPEGSPEDDAWFGDELSPTYSPHETVFQGELIVTLI